MDHKTLLSKYTNDWRLSSEGSKRVKNDLAGVRRTRTALKKMMTRDFEEVLQAEHVLALRAAANVLGELDQALAKLTPLVEAAQKQQKSAQAAERVKEINQWILARNEEAWTQSEEAAAIESTLLEEFHACSREWVSTQRNKTFHTFSVGRVACYGGGGLTEPDGKLAVITPRQRLAVRLSQIPSKGAFESAWGGSGLHYSYGRDDFQAWKAMRASAAGAISKAMAQAQ